MGLQIILPSSVEKPKWRCTVPTGPGKVCGHPAWSEREALSHAETCANQHENEIHAESPRSKLPFFYDSERYGDPEYEQHMAKVGKRMVAEGRMETRPNER